MFKKMCRKTSLVLIPLLITVCFFTWYSSFLETQITAKYNSAIGHLYGLPETNSGMFLLKQDAQKGDLMIFGSSELSAKVPQNPKYMFPNQQLNRDVVLVGQAYVQDLSHAIRVGALSESLKDKKIVFLVSLQWFLGEDIKKEGYQSNFSELQFYSLMNNQNISGDVKRYVCKRASDLTAGESSFVYSKIYADLYQKGDVFSRMALAWLKPYYFLREKVLSLKDKYQSYQMVLLHVEDPVPRQVTIDWQHEKAKAQAMGKSVCTNNDFFVNDDYYDTYLKDKITKLKNSSENVSLLESKEWEDYRTLLEVCKGTRIQPYFVFTPTNGWYYDYIGITQKERTNFYDKLNDITAEYGYSCLNLSDKEYEPYFLKDVMHLGWEGWTYVNEKITEFYS